MLLYHQPMVVSIVSYIDLFISIYNKKLSVFLSFALCTKKKVPVLFSPLCILLHVVMRREGGAMGIGTWPGRGVVWGGFKSESPEPSPWCEFL